MSYSLPFVCIANEVAHSLPVIGEEMPSIMPMIYISPTQITTTIYGLLREFVKITRQDLYQGGKLGRTRWRSLNLLQHGIQLSSSYATKSLLLCTFRSVRGLLITQVFPIHIPMMHITLKTYFIHGWLIISSTPFLPIRWSAEVMSLIIIDPRNNHRLMKSMHSGEQFLLSTSWRLKYACQCST